MPVTDTAEVAVNSAVTSGWAYVCALVAQRSISRPVPSRIGTRNPERHQPHGVAEEPAHQTIFLSAHGARSR